MFGDVGDKFLDNLPLNVNRLGRDTVRDRSLNLTCHLLGKETTRAG